MTAIPLTHACAKALSLGSRVGVLLYCDELGLIGREMFAVDGCKFSSNASKEWSGTRAELEKKRGKFRAAVEKLVTRRRAMDKDGLLETVPGKRAREEKAVESFKAKTAKIDAWLRENPKDKMGLGAYAGARSMDISSRARHSVAFSRTRISVESRGYSVLNSL